MESIEQFKCSLDHDRRIVNLPPRNPYHHELSRVPFYEKLAVSRIRVINTTRQGAAARPYIRPDFVY